ncbi:phosphatidylglycerophosphatase A [Alcanivorax sp. N3-2A]|nr:phosphatidylglycerophosphatase A [Alcanivorax sp. N3-2A]|tara:strand:- start:4067 stop:4540 length:474 start_codon:yes stop_codon:yes gene_type:complete
MNLDSVIVFIAQGLGAGLSPYAPGTVASLVFLLPWWWLAGLPRVGYWALWGVICLIGVPLCGQASSVLGVHDAPSIVWDEFGGLLLALAVVPRGVGWGLAGFLAFRLFDVTKPGPVGWVDSHFNNGAGIVADDLIAGAFALLVMLMLRWWIAGRARA